MIAQAINHAPMRWTITSCALLFFPGMIFGQEIKQSPSLRDTSKRIYIMGDISRHVYAMPPTLALSPFMRAKLELFSDVRPQSMGLSYPISLYPSLEQDLSVQTMWLNALQNDRKFETLWMVLGSLEFGGAAYVAYRHIKKYGIW